MTHLRLLYWVWLGLVCLTGCLSKPEIGTAIDSHKGVEVYANGSFRNSHGRHLAANGYNFGLKWQCLEFAKRYYAQALSHQMPETYGHARDFFIEGLDEGSFNQQRGLYQFPNGSHSPPKADDLLVWGKSFWNEFGHIAVITHVTEGEVHFIQQNKGTQSRGALPLKEKDGIWTIPHSRIKGWLGKRRGA